MLDSITWGTWEQLHWRGSHIEYTEGIEESEGSNEGGGRGGHGSSRSGPGRRAMQQLSGAHASSWRHRSTSKKGSQAPLFERLLDKLLKQAPAVLPTYRTPLHGASNASRFRSLPAPCLPEAGGLDETRADNKTEQVQNLLEATCALVEVLLLQRRRKREQWRGPLQKKSYEAATPDDRIHVVEFCGGAGYVAIPLAALYSPSEVRVTLLDMKTHSLDIARRRVADASLSNIDIRRERLEDFDASSSSASSFDIGVALHACGAASDLSQELCLTHRAAYVMAPCCIGKIRSSRRPGVTRRAKGGARSISARHAQHERWRGELALLNEDGDIDGNYGDGDDGDDDDGPGEGDEGTLNSSTGSSSNNLRCGRSPSSVGYGEMNAPTDPSTISYPRSGVIRGVLSTAEWATVARAGDFGHREVADYDAGQRRRRVAKAFIEADRQLRAGEAGYATLTSIMLPRTATPKNDVLVGWPREWGSDESSNVDNGICTSFTGSAPLPEAQHAADDSVSKALIAPNFERRDQEKEISGGSDGGEESGGPTSLQPHMQRALRALEPHLFGL
jgi:hypothetical protein